MIAKQALARAREILLAGHIEEVALESEVLLRHTLGIDRTQLFLELERELSQVEEESFFELVKRRLNREPTAYITGHREFYGHDFHVDHNVLIPRPESELLVEKTIEIAQNHALSTIAEVGTGCGAIAISLALSLPRVQIYAIDISPAALRIATLNCRTHGVTDRVHLIAGDMLDPLPVPVDLIVANLPYVRESELTAVNTLHFEPSLALNGGEDGLEKIRKLCTRIDKKLRPEGWLLLEVGQGQSDALASFLRTLFPSARIELSADLSGIERMVSLGLTSVR